MGDDDYGKVSSVGGEMRVLTNEREISRAQRKLKAALTRNAYCRPVTVGYPGGQSDNRPVHWHSGPDFWVAFGESNGLPEITARAGRRARKRKEPHFWNAFGLEHPDNRVTLNRDITVEINPVVQGIDRSLGGIFVERGASVYLCHTGKVGGGAPGVGKGSFRKWYKHGKWKVVDWGGDDADVVVVCNVDAPDLVERVGEFVHHVANYKSLIRSRREKSKTQAKGSGAKRKKAGKKGKPTPESIEKQNRKKITKRFKLGPLKIKKYLLHKVIRPTAEHSKIVSALRMALRPRITESPNNTDCVVMRGDLVTHLFEVKSKNDSQSVFTAVGQLFCYATKLLKEEAGSKYAAVLPVPPKAAKKAEWQEILEQIDIEVVWFERVNSKYRFIGLNEFMEPG